MPGSVETQGVSVSVTDAHLRLFSFIPLKSAGIKGNQAHWFPRCWKTCIKQKWKFTFVSLGINFVSMVWLEIDAFMELFRNNCYNQSKGKYAAWSSIIKHILNECCFFQAVHMMDTFRKIQRIISSYTSLTHQPESCILPSRVFLLINWEPLPEVAFSTELQVALLSSR